MTGYAKAARYAPPRRTMSGISALRRLRSDSSMLPQHALVSAWLLPVPAHGSSGERSTVEPAAMAPAQVLMLVSTLPPESAPWAVSHGQGLAPRRPMEPATKKLRLRWWMRQHHSR